MVAVKLKTIVFETLSGFHGPSRRPVRGTADPRGDGAEAAAAEWFGQFGENPISALNNQLLKEVRLRRRPQADLSPPTKSATEDIITTNDINESKGLSFLLTATPSSQFIYTFINSERQIATALKTIYRD